MTPARKAGNDPQEWLNRAKSNLVRAKEDIRLSGVFLEDLCFDAQQATEKAIKAVLIRRNIQFPYVHDLMALLALIEKEGESLPEPVKQAGRLTRFAVVTRYPGLEEPVTREEYERAVIIAEAVVQWAGKQVKKPKRQKRR
ncbi:MAG: HEPN domain-containing protein [Deltaproteobacteria bacterium]|nr:HEPN domain-containing protein [Deltaproteobacteria bacterium]